MPQIFINNISRNINKSVLDLQLKDIFSKNIFNIKKENSANFKKFNHNLFVFQYLEKHTDISKNSNFYLIKNLKYSQIFKEYLRSKEFEIEISKLFQEKENENYIKKYIIKAMDFIHFLSQ